MIVGLLKNFVKARRRPKSRSIELSAWEIENRARRERFPDNPSPRVEPFYGCSNNAPWYRAAVERERLLEEWWDYLGAESERRGGAYPFPIMEPGLHAPEPYVAPIGIEIDPDPCTRMSRPTGVGGYPQDSICKCRSCRSKLVDYRVHGWDKIERPTSVIEP